MYCKYDEPEMIRQVEKDIAAGEVENLRFYLADGLDPDQRGTGGRPLLIQAVLERRVDSAEVLLAFGADPNIKALITNHTPLHYAANDNNGAMVALLAGHGANPEAVDVYGWTPLHMAADHGTVEAIRALVAAGANVQAQDRDGRTPRDRAVAQYKRTLEDRHFVCAEQLRAAELQLDAEGLKHEKAERDIAALKAHNPKRFRLKF